MNIVWWAAVACAVVAIVGLVVAFTSEDNSNTQDIAGFCVGVGLVCAIVLFLAGSFVEDSLVQKQQKKELQAVGFTYVNVDALDAAVVSMPQHNKGCRLKLEKTDKFWMLLLPKDQTRSVVSAADTAKWPSIIDWCGQPKAQ